MDHDSPAPAPPGASSPAPARATPPPVLPPPPLKPPPLVVPPSRARRGGGWKWFGVLLGVGVVLVVVLLWTALGRFGRAFEGLAGLGAGTALQAAPRFEEVVIEDEGAGVKVALIEVQGVISSLFGDASGNTLPDLIRHQLKRAERDSRVRAVVLKINSPGGEVLASDEINRELVEFQKRTRKPVVASMGGVAASGGYYIAAPCRWIVAHDLTITGSIGVIMHGYNYRGLMDKVGVRPEVYKSGKFKDMMSGDRRPEEVLPEEREMLQGLIGDTYARFAKVVLEGRAEAARLNRDQGTALVENWREYADGRVFLGAQAKAYGFVDELGDFKAAIARAKSIAGLAKANLIQYRQPFDLGSLFSLFGRTEARSLKVDLGIDLPKLELGRMYFLFLPGAH